MELLDQIKEEVAKGSVSEYSEFDAKLAEFKSEVPDTSTKSGYDRAKEIAGILTKTRTAIEAKRKDYKAPVLALGKLIDGEAKRITEEVSAIEVPFKDAYRAVDNEKKRIKEEISAKIQGVKDLPKIAMEKSSEEIELMIEELAEMDVSKSVFGRRTEEVAELVSYILPQLSESKDKAIEREEEAIKIEAERVELEKLRAEQAEREAAEREAAERAEREAEEARIAEEAAERARIEAENNARAERDRVEREKQEAIEREAEAKRQAEESERRRIEAEMAAEAARVEAQAEAKRQAEEAAEMAKQMEIRRQQAEREAEEEAKALREANNRHAGNIRRQAKEDIMSLGVDEDTAKKVVLAIVRNQVRNITINY